MAKTTFPCFGMNSWPYLDLLWDSSIKCEDSLLNIFKPEPDLSPTPQNNRFGWGSVIAGKSGSNDVNDKKPLIDKVDWNTAGNSYYTKDFTVLESAKTKRTKHKNKLNVLIDKTNLIWYKSLKTNASVNDFFKQEANLFPDRKPRVMRNNCVFGIDAINTNKKRKKNGRKIKTYINLNRTKGVRVVVDPRKALEHTAVTGLLALSEPPSPGFNDVTKKLKPMKVVINSGDVQKYGKAKGIIPSSNLMSIQDIKVEAVDSSVGQCASPGLEQLPTCEPLAEVTDNIPSCMTAAKDISHCRVVIDSSRVLRYCKKKGINSYPPDTQDVDMEDIDSSSIIGESALNGLDHLSLCKSSVEGSNNSIMAVKGVTGAKVVIDSSDVLKYCKEKGILPNSNITNTEDLDMEVVDSCSLTSKVVGKYISYEYQMKSRLTVTNNNETERGDDNNLDSLGDEKMVSGPSGSPEECMVVEFPCCESPQGNLIVDSCSVMKESASPRGEINNNINNKDMNLIVDSCSVVRESASPQGEINNNVYNKGMNLMADLFSVVKESASPQGEINNNVYNKDVNLMVDSFSVVKENASSRGEIKSNVNSEDTNSIVDSCSVVKGNASPGDEISNNINNKDMNLIVDSCSVVKENAFLQAEVNDSINSKDVNLIVDSCSVMKENATKIVEPLPLLRSLISQTNSLNSLLREVKQAVDTSNVLEQYVAKGIGQLAFSNFGGGLSNNFNDSGQHANLNKMKNMKVTVDSSDVVPLLTACSVCDEKVPSSKLMAHLRSHVEIYACSFCPKRFERKSQLRGHVQIHKVMLPLNCSKCDMSFKRNAELKKHLRIHDGEKRFVCLHCNKRFRQSSHLDVHLPTHFPREKPYECTLCNKKFAQSNNRNRHFKTCLKKSGAGKDAV